jgi:hypothetical protein
MKVYGSSIGRSIQLGVLFVALGVAADTRAEDPINKTTAIAPRLPSKTRVVHVGLSEVTAIAAQKGWFQEEFSKHNAKVDLVATNAYGAAGTIAALFDRGELHIATGMMNGSLHRRANYKDAVQAIKKYIKYQVAYRDPFFTKFQLTDKEIEDGLVDKRFYAGGEYFVDVGGRRQ